MKRFIALVLSLVMALSLCVPAFGATTQVGTADELVKALEGGDDVVLITGIKIDPATLSSGYGTTGINVKNGQAIDGGGFTLDIQGAGGTWDSGICIAGGTVKNITVTGSFRGIFVKDNTQKTVLENVTTTGTTYTISCDQGGGGGLEATNCAFYGWTSFAATLGNATFTNCTFGEGSGYAFCRPYAPTTFVGCTFEEGFRMDPRAAVYFDNCTIGGVALTADNLATLVTSRIENATVLSNAVIPEVEVEAADPKVEPNENLTGADKDAADVIAATGGVTIDKTELESAATGIAANTEVTEAEAVKALVDAGHSTAGATVVVESRFEVVVDDVDVDNGTIALDITPVYQVVATNGTDKVVLEEGELDLENEAVEIKVQIPAALATKGKLYVAHDGSELYEAAVTKDGGKYYATFTTTSGFSPYVLYTDLQALLAAAAVNGDTVTLMGNVELPEQLTLPEGVTLDGNGYTISVAGDNWSTVNGYKNLVLLSKDTTLKNVTLDSEGKAYGVQAYCVTGVKLENVSIINSKGAGLTVNGATVDAVNLKASGNAWGSVNVDPGSGVTTESSFAVSGANTNLADATSIWSDGNNVTAGTNDVEVAISGGAYAGAINVPAAAGDVEITGGTFATDVSAYLDNDVFQDGAGNVVASPTNPIISSGATLTTDFDKRAEARFAAWDAKISLKDSENAKKSEFATYEIEMIAKINDAPIWWASGVAKKDKDVDFKLYGEDEFVMVATEDQAEIVIIDGKTITYLARASRYNTNGWAAEADEVTLPYSVAAKYVCDTFYTLDPAATTFYKYDGVLYTASTLGTAGVKVFNVDGVAVAVVPTKVSDLSNGAKAAKNAEVVYTGHTYQLDSKGNTYKESELTKVYCDLCDTSFDVVVGGAADAIDKFGVNGYVDTGYNWPKNSANNVYVGKTVNGSYVPSRPSGSTSTDKVTSAPTFDAGIAMYVGMSVMAAAGSVVVLKKRED